MSLSAALESVEPKRNDIAKAGRGHALVDEKRGVPWDVGRRDGPAARHLASVGAPSPVFDQSAASSPPAGTPIRSAAKRRNDVSAERA